MLELYKEEFVEIGFIRKAYGFNGQAKIVLLNSWEDEIKTGDFVFLEIDGYKVPFHVEELDFNKDIIIKLEFINSSEELLPYLKSSLFLLSRNLLSPIGEKDAPLSHRYVHYTIRDINTGRSGLILRIDEYPQQEMAVVLGEQNEDLLIPLHDALITSINDEDKLIDMDLPEGLL